MRAGRCPRAIRRAPFTSPIRRKEIKNKINKHAFSGGGATIEEQRKRSEFKCRRAMEVVELLLEDDEKLKEIGEKYGGGEMLTGEIKQILVEACWRRWWKFIRKGER